MLKKIRTKRLKLHKYKGTFSTHINGSIHWMINEYWENTKQLTLTRFGVQNTKPIKAQTGKTARELEIERETEELKQISKEIRDYLWAVKQISYRTRDWGCFLTSWNGFDQKTLGIKIIETRKTKELEITYPANELWKLK